MKSILAVLVVIMMCSCVSNTLAPQEYQLLSPNKNISLSIAATNGKLCYTIDNHGARVLEPSQLGIIFKDRAFAEDMRIVRASPTRPYEDNYTLLHGKKRSINYRANEKTLTLENAKNQRMQIVFRVSNDGVAFKYRLLGEASENVVFVEEHTSFAFPSGSKAWLQPMAVAQTGWKNTNPSYEEHYLMAIDVGTPSPSAAGWVFPALFKVEQTWLAITEAGMEGRFHASRLHAQSEGGEYFIGLPMEAEVFTGRALLASGSLPFESPWRVLAIGSLADLVESTLGTDLASPAITDMHFVQPGFVSWSWALLKDEATNFETQKSFIDYAAAMQWPYTLIDAEWDKRIGKDKIEELVKYARSKNVGILLWYNSSGDWNQTALTPKNVLLTEESRKREFAWLQSIGVKGIKIDFFAGDGQSMMAYYNDLAREAANYGLVVNYHGASLPRGLHRTYPNLLTMESVHGFEMITFNQHSADVAAKHIAMLPFTRNLFDPMDFTPTAFSPIPGIEKRTRDGFELALPVLMLSGLQHIAETAEGMAQQPEFIKEILATIPVSWDETKFLDGYPGEYVVIARRKGNTWYVAGINGGSSTRQLSLNLEFSGSRTGVIVTDAPDDKIILKEFMTTELSTVEIMPGGGFLIKLE